MKTQSLCEMMHQQSALMKALAAGKAIFGFQIIVMMNCSGYSFPHWAAEDQLGQLAKTLQKTIKRMRNYSHAKIYRWSELSQDERLLLRQRELLTLQEAPRGGTHTYVALNKRQDSMALINGEEHLQLEVFEEAYKSFNVGDLLTEMIMLQSRLADEITETPACDDDLLYLMSDPKKNGEGMGAAAWVCLPAVVQTLGPQHVYQQVEEAGLLMRPAFGTPQGVETDTFRIDIKPLGMVSLGDSLNTLCGVLKKLSASETRQRKKLLTQKKLGAIWSSRLAQVMETVQMGAPICENDLPGILSVIRLAVLLGKTNCSQSQQRKLLTRMQAETQSGYMKLCPGETDHPTELDVRRGEVMRGLLAALFSSKNLSTTK